MISWLVFWLIAQSIARSQGCLKCSKEAMALKKEFTDHFLEKKLRREPDLKKNLKKLVDDAIEGLSHQRIDPEKYMAMIDETTLGILATHFKRYMNRIMESDFEDGQLFNEVNWSLQKLLATFQEIMPTITKLHCSNECGVMMYVSTNCFNCITRSHTCNKGIYCGERRVQVEMDEDLILDCALRWHKASHGVKKYRFYRVVNGKEQVMTTGEDSFLVKKEANSNDTGRYRCEMLDPEGHLSSRLDFHVVVLSPVGKTTWFTRPHLTTMEGSLALGVSSRAPPPQEDWTAWIVIACTGGLLFLVVAAL
ncbi:hypothetical protein JD844_001423 [Phrynosoma platyrhinos]|uniref:Izumo protein immunoglobulin domain-containing protein n=1 Tax=Phrynosoma platyrhinos TaxID=52577 RepID=A0ABQ7T9M4_PHRPL|nr:hypothetical protein JD844_001423 [Phrynosoma platyrhinos]